MKLGIVARADNTGLGNQTRELVNMLNPDKILLVDSYSFKNNPQFPEWYDGYDITKNSAEFPTKDDIRKFLDGLDVVISCETFYNHDFIKIARSKNIKTILQYNYEFLDYLVYPQLDYPDVLVAPSMWNFEKVKKLFGDKTKVIYLPPPTDHKTFESVRKNNLSTKHGRILHIMGRKAAKDRNGTDSVIQMLKYSTSDYELVVRTQFPLDNMSSDKRLTVDVNDIKNREDMYDGFDAMVLPRRYAGLCLPMNEALMSGLPVFMTDVSPNNIVLPQDWLVPARPVAKIKTRTSLDVYDADKVRLGRMIDRYIDGNNIEEYKNKAFEIGINLFSYETLKQKYIDLINE